MAQRRDHFIVWAIGLPWAAGRAIVVVFTWLGDRLHDLAMWAVELVRCLPIRLKRLALVLLRGLSGLFDLFPGLLRSFVADGAYGAETWLRRGLRKTAAWLMALVLASVDLVGLPEFAEFVVRALSRCSVLSGSEVAVLAVIFGPDALRYGDVRVTQAGILRAVHALNRGRAFAMYHTVVVPRLGPYTRDHLDVLVHETVHVYQYEKLGSLYVGEALQAQAGLGYGYGGSQGLCQARIAGKHYADFNREQQAQIVQDYYWLLCHEWDSSVYEPYIGELRGGQL